MPTNATFRSGPGTCRLCGSEGLRKVLDLGDMPLADQLVKPEDVGKQDRRFALELGWCPECTLVQISDSPPPSVLFTDSFPYYSSVSDTFSSHARRFAGEMVAERRLGASSLVLEIASNDGYLLRHFKAAGVSVLGFDPAPGPTGKAREEGLDCRCAFFTAELARQLADDGIQADLIAANNVLAHVPDPNDLIEGVSLILKPDGLASFEFPYVVDLVAKTEFDTIYHEHHSYFSVTSIGKLLERHGMRIAGIRHLPIHGGSLRILASHADVDGARPDSEEVVQDYLRNEEAAGVRNGELFDGFAHRVALSLRWIRETLHGLKAAGHSVVAYGAAAKGAMLLNAAGIDGDILDFVADRNPAKQGLYMPGVHVPIVPPSAIAERRPDYVLLLSWNLAEEIFSQQREYVEAGGRFVVPLPKPGFYPPDSV